VGSDNEISSAQPQRRLDLVDAFVSESDQDSTGSMEGDPLCGPWEPSAKSRGGLEVGSGDTEKPHPLGLCHDPSTTPRS
jgi:hypothetical protein